ncbi:MAG TPA: Type 1 glutamine amidotransferase-like domain-containing protein [Candidatus Limnocylindrales bacterium]|nr:Type 1 glutamine amidotransferase-like domain-containing protein [Candidatus Limnocylindrales bacterium]
MTGPVALVGSGEYTPAMLEVDRLLLEGRAPRYVQIPTAAAPEGQASLDKWIGMGIAHAESLGVQPVSLVVRHRDDAGDPELVKQLEGAGLIYFSGGDPHYLTETFRDTPMWTAIVEAWHDGAALGGCSAGAMAFGGWVPSVRRPMGAGRQGLGLLPNVCVLPHFDRYFGRLPGLAMRALVRTGEGITTVGVDEDTALVGGPDEFTVMGKASAWVIKGSHRVLVRTGETIRL